MAPGPSTDPYEITDFGAKSSDVTVGVDCYRLSKPYFRIALSVLLSLLSFPPLCPRLSASVTFLSFQSMDTILAALFSKYREILPPRLSPTI